MLRFRPFASALARRRFASRLSLPLLLTLVAAFVMPALAVRAQDTPPPPPPPPEADAPPTTAPTTTPTTPTGTPPTQPPPPPSSSGNAPAGGRYLLLPDISFIGTFIGHGSTDKRDGQRDRLRLDSGELSIQSFVYPEIKADAFAVFSDGAAVLEEAYLTVQNVGLGNLPLSAQVGRRKVPFGRVNQLHSHSWLYIVQPYVLSNLVAGESLNGDGGYVSYLLPTKNIFSQLDLGFWSASETPEDIDAQQNPTQQIIGVPGVEFADRFVTARLWTAADALGGTVELGGSAARGGGTPYNLTPPGVESPFTVKPTTQLTGLDFTYRRAQTGASRILIRSEYVRHYQEDAGQHFKRGTDGYYVLADKRFGEFQSIAARYDESGFPFAEGRERAVSLIGTRQLTEQTYFRLQGIHGDRPGKKGLNEIWFQWVWGIGPHTHNLE